MADIVDDTSPDEVELDRESAFDKLRIENYTALRMGAIRARSWWIIGCFLCVVAVMDMIAKSTFYVYIFRKWGINPTLRAVVAIAMIKLAKHSWRRAADFKREIERSAIPEPTTQPDFSTLNNGSDQWKNLENVR